MRKTYSFVRFILDPAGSQSSNYRSEKELREIFEKNDLGQVIRNGKTLIVLNTAQKEILIYAKL